MWIKIFLILLKIGLHLADSQNAKTCGYPGSPAHASVTFSSDTMEVGTFATYVCNNGYELLGPHRRLCNANGTWSPQGVPFCVLNVAIGKAAMQSSTLASGGGSAQKAVDGSTSQFHTPATCTATAPETSPWWYVNLLEPYLVQLVRIDFGDIDALSNIAANEAAHLANNQIIVVRVGNTRPDLGTNSLCNTYRGRVEPGRPLYLPCTRPMAGAFVSVHIENASNTTSIKRSLSICETFVFTDYALSTEQCPSFRGQALGSTATYNGKCYIFYHNQQMDFDSAKRLCEIRGGTLVDETSPALQGFLSWELYRRHRADLSGQYWLGLHREQNPSGEQNWRWINGKELKLSFWNLPGSNVPSTPAPNPDLKCARFDGAKGWLWSETSCSTKLNFICQHRPLSCGKPERPTNSTILARSVDIGSIIEYRCSPGNLLVGPNLRTCLPNGFFSEYAPKCKYVECGDPAPIHNGQYTLINGTKSYLSQVQYSCQIGFILVGRSLLTCDNDWKWNGPPPRCEPVMCAQPEQFPNGYVKLSSEGTRFGARAQYGCLPGFQLHGKNHSLLCSIQGNWLGEIPTCKEIKISTTTTTTTTTTSTTSSPPVTFDLTKSFTSSSADSSIPNTIYASTTNKTLEEYGTSTRNKFEPHWSRIPILTSSSKQSTSSSTTHTTTEQPAIIYSSTSRSVTANNNNRIKSSSSTVKPSTADTFAPTTTSNKKSSKQQIYPGKNSDFQNKIPQIVTKNNNSEKIDGINSISRKSTSPKAKFNMVGIIALAIFGSFVFLAAIITIVIIVFRRYKHTSSSLDAQTISTLDSNNDQNLDLYRKYQKAWENINQVGFTGNSYKPANRLDNGVEYTFNPLNLSSQHMQVRTNQATNFRNGIYNEEYRDVNEITLNADVAALYSRPDRATNARPKKDNLMNELYQQNIRRKF